MEDVFVSLSVIETVEPPRKILTSKMLSYQINEGVITQIEPQRVNDVHGIEGSAFGSCFTQTLNVDGLQDFPKGSQRKTGIVVSVRPPGVERIFAEKLVQ